jgi:hypothetical protein
MLDLSAPNEGKTMNLSIKDIKAAMERTFKIEDDFSADTVKEFNAPGDGKGYLIDRGPVEFSRGTAIEAYVFIIYPDGETVAEKLTVPGEVELWTTHLEVK